MVSILRYNYTNDGKFVIAFAGEFSDTKPIDIYKSFPLGQGCTFLEIDTGDTYMLEEDGSWTQIETGGKGFKIEVVDELPDTGEDGVLYLVPKTTGSPEDGHYEYVWVSAQTKFELVGTTDISPAHVVSTSSTKVVSGVTIPVLSQSDISGIITAMCTSNIPALVYSSTLDATFNCISANATNTTVILGIDKYHFCEYAVSQSAVLETIIDFQFGSTPVQIEEEPI